MTKPMSSTTTTESIEPEDSVPHRVVVALHGHGESAASARQWAFGLLPGTSEIHTVQAETNSEGIRSWFETGPYGVVANDLADSVQRVRDTVAELNANGQEVILAGFSQGGAVAMSAVYLGIDCVAAMAFCSFFPEVDWGQVRAQLGQDDSGEAIASAKSVPLLVLGRTEDPDVPSFFSEDAHNFLHSSGYSSSLVMLSGGHEVSEVVRSAARTWLDSSPIDS